MAKFLDNSGLATVFSIIKRHIPTKTSDLTNDSGFITDAGVTSFNGDTGDVTYTAPVTSVNGDTGAVSLDADDIPYNGSQSVFEKISEIVTQGGEPNVIETVEQNGTPLTVTNKTVNVIVPTATSDLTNDSNFVSDASYTHIDVVDTYSSSGTDAISGTGVANALATLDSSVSAETNKAISAITITDGKISANSKISIPTAVSDLTNDSGFLTSSDAVTSFNGSTGAITYTAPVTSVNSETGAVVLDATDIAYDSNNTVKEKIDSIISSGGEPNVIEVVKQNNVPLVVTDKAVNVTVPTKTSDLNNDSGFITSADVPVTAVSVSGYTLFITNAVLNGDGDSY